MLKTILAAAAVILSSAGAVAQPPVPPNPSDPARELPYDRGYDKPTARGDAINAQEGAVTARLNAGEAAASTMQIEDTQAQYQADRDSYMSALAAHDRAVDRTDARYARQQTAYADAMRAWYGQVRACKRGDRRACDAPAPRIADFY